MLKALLTFVFIFLLRVVHAQSGADSLINILNTASLTKTERIGVLVQLYERTAPRAEAKQFIDKAFALAKQAGDSAALINTARLMGFAYMDAGNYPQAVSQLKQALAWARNARVREQEKSILNSIGISFGEMNMYDSALAYHFASLELREKMGDSRAVYVALNNIGVIYINLNVPAEALRYLLAARDAAEKGKFTPGAELNLNIGSSYEKATEYDRAIKFVNEGLSQCNGACDDRFLSKAYTTLAKSYYGKEKLNEAAVFANKAITAADISSDFFAKGIMELMLAKIRLRENDYSKAISILKESEDKLKDVVSPVLKAEILFTLHQAYEALDDIRQSNFYLKKYTQLNDSIAQYQLAATLGKIQAQYEERANLQKIREQAEVIKLKEEVLYRQRLQMAFITVIACLGAVLTYVLIRFARVLHIKKTALSEKNRQLTEAQDKLKKMALALDAIVEDRTKDLAGVNRALENANDELDHFIYKTSHDIRGPLATLTGLAQLGSMEAHESAAKNYLARIAETATRLSHVVSRLAVINQLNRNELQPVVVCPEELVSRIMQRHISPLPPDTVRTAVMAEPGISMVSDEWLLEICLDNLISNAIKYRTKNERVQPFVEVHIEQKLQVVRFRVIDNGIGISSLAPGKLFRMFMRASEQSQTGGVGLYLAKLSALRLFGKLHYARTADERTVFSLLVPANLKVRMDQMEAQLAEKKQQEGQVRSGVQALAQDAP
jgi:signal transduction histidine kinase